jgi:hypothetical protein
MQNENSSQNDPIEHIEKLLKEINDNTGKKTGSSLKKYPITYALLVTFALVSILHGFELFFDKVVLIHNHPWILILGGLFVLIITGSVYKSLEK